MAKNITLSWTKSELVTYISNHSAFVAQSLSLSGDVAFDYNTLTEDNEKTYLDDKISEAINTLVPHFARIIDDDADVLEGDKYGLVFTPRIEGGSYSKAELSHIKTLCRKFIASYILADWYSMKGIAAMNNYFVSQSTQSSAELNVVLNRFVRPVRKASVNVGRVSYVSKANVDYTHINNRSDFALVWGTANGAPLPNGEYDVDFYTDGEVIRSFNSLDTDVVKPIEDNPNKVRIIFDFSDGNYFANGVLKYTMRGSIQDADFPDGERYFEQSGETTIEIWDGASDADGKVSTTFIPSYMKLQFSDLTPEDIAILQAPALEAAEVANEATASANSASVSALSQGNYAKEQGDYAQNQGSYARSQAGNAYTQAYKAQKVANDWTGENGGVGYKSLIEKTISDAEDTIDAKVQDVDGYLLGASQAESARAEAEEERVIADENRRVVFAEKIAESEEATASANSAAARAEGTINSLDKKLEKKADVDKRYPKMTAGFAQEIVGDGSATPEEFSFRPTAGEDRNVANTTYYDGERNGVARIEKIKGNSLVYNQGLKFALDQTAKNGWWFRDIKAGGNPRIEGNKICYEVLESKKSTQQISQYCTIISGHKYFVHFWYNTNGIINDGYGRAWRFAFSTDLSGNGIQSFIAPENRITSGYVDRIVTANDEYNYKVFILKEPYINIPGGATIEHTMEWADIWLIDLTKMFRAGNEPTTIEEFWQRLPQGIDLSQYNEGEIINGNYGGIKTVGFNAFNGTYAKVCAGCSYYLGGNYTSLGFTTEEGGTTEAIALPTSAESVGTTPSDRLYTPSQNGYIYAEGENININISWDTEYGYLNGTYQPYKPFERDLSWIGRIKDSNGNLAFPNGMRSAGSVRDEIWFNPTTQMWEAVQKVGVRAYAEGDAEDTSVTTDGTNTNYALANTFVTEISEDINLDFDVSDYGTEELIVAEGAQSAPLVADITYAPNALSTLKQVPDILKRLKALESAVASATATTNEEETVE